MTLERWIQIEGLYTSILMDARDGLRVSCADPSAPLHLSAALILMGAAARSLPVIAEHYGPDAVAQMEGLRDQVLAAILRAVEADAEDDVPPAFRKAFGGG